MDVKGNFKHGNTNLECTKCEKEVETQQHILQNEALSSNSVMTQLQEYEDLQTYTERTRTRSDGLD